MNKKHTLISRKTVALVCFLSIIIGAFSTILSAATEYVYDKPLESNMWEEPNFDDPSTYAYSFAFVGDTQCLTIGDRLNGTNNVERLYKYIAGTAEERKLEHVFVLGDITEVGYWNDYNMVGQAKDWPTVTEEWPLVQKAIFQLNGKVKYSLCRGNHDDYMMDDYFNVPEYTDQFEGNGGFFSDTGATYPDGGRNKEKNPTGAVYWSATTGVHDETIVNSWRTMELYGTKYLFITVDYNPSKAVANWVDETLAKYPDHKAIITTHSYMKSTGELIESEKSEMKYPTAFAAANMWSKVYSKHANVFMIVCGHATGANVPIYTINTGENGNKVYQFLINPQTYDLKEARKVGESNSGKQDQGLVMYMNFSEDGNTVSLNYYSTLLNKFLKGANFVIDLDKTPNEYGPIDMAGLSEFGQDTPLLTDKKTPTIDGVINEDEYSLKKVTEKGNIAKGSIGSDIVEYFAYDDNYIYYAVKIKVVNLNFNIHPEGALYSADALKKDTYSNSVTITLGKLGCKVSETGGYSKLVFNKDIFYSLGTDTEENRSVYELKIDRKYLKNNGAPDNLLSYSLGWGSSVHGFKLNDQANTFLKNAGVTDKLDWAYNYVYFDTRLEVKEEADTTDTTATDVSENENTEIVGSTAAVENTGCKATLALAPIICITAIAASTVVLKKKKD